MWILFPLGFAIALVQSDLFAGQAFRQLLSELASRPTPEGWRDDRGRRLSTTRRSGSRYWDPDAGQFRDAAGGELAHPPERSGRQWLEVTARRHTRRGARRRRRARREPRARRRGRVGDPARRRDRPARGPAARVPGSRSRRRRCRAAPDRARSARHRAAAARRPAGPSQPRRRAASARGAADRRAARAGARRGARRAAERRARHLPAGARAVRPRRRVALGGADRRDPGEHHGRRPAPPLGRRRAGRLLLLPGSAPERREARRARSVGEHLALRRRRRASVPRRGRRAGLRAGTASSAARVSRTWPTGSRPSAGSIRIDSTAGRGTCVAGQIPV